MRFWERLTSARTPDLVGERLVLRRPSRSDYPAWRDLRAESRDFLAPWEPRWAHDELTRHCYGERLSRYREDESRRMGASYFLFDRQTNALCGGITLGNIRRGVAQTGTLGYWMGARFAGRGLMAEAVRLVARHAFDTECLHRLEAACLPRNVRSIALLEKSGFTFEGHLRKYLMIDGAWEDHRLYALLAEDGRGTPVAPLPSGRPASSSDKAFVPVHD